MTGVVWARLRHAFSHASHSGFPWAMGFGDVYGHTRAFRRALRRSVVDHWPRGTRLAGQVLMALLWPLQSLHDAIAFTFQIDRAELGGRGRMGVALRAWRAALAYNLPPVDYLCYRLFEPGRPGPGHWLHSADAHLHFRAVAAPEVCALAEDKLAFADLGASIGAGVMPVLAVYGAGGPKRPFAGGAPPPIDLLVKPRHGHGGREQMVWRWDGRRHIADDPVSDPGFDAWLDTAARSGDLLVQRMAHPPERIGPVVPSLPPVLSVLTAEWPDGRRCAAFALLTIALQEDGEKVYINRQIEVASGCVLPAQPGQIRSVWGDQPDGRDCSGFTVPDWPEILAGIDMFHAVMPGPAPVLKWDYILTDEGPRLLETNTGTGVYLLQEMTLRPITETPVGAALEAWARWHN